MGRRKWVCLIVSCVVFVFTASYLLGVYSEREIGGWVYDTTNKIVGEIEESEKNEDVLKKYGIEKNAFRPVLFASGATVISLCGIGMLVCGMCYERRSQKKKLREMEDYCEKILSGVYSLDIRDNEEGSFSILKNKVYDITVYLREQNRYLERTKKEIEAFLADISHQIKTPITSLHMTNELLRMELPIEKKELFLDNMQQDIHKIEWLVKSILNLAKLESGTLSLKKESCKVCELSEEIVRYFSAFCEVTGSRIDVQADEQIQMDCDYKWTKEAICNIVKNAIEHGAKQTCLRWEENYIYTKLEITDDGEGIEKEDLPHIFERFYKSKNSREESVGLGLAFSKAVMEYQNGTVQATSKKGKGTVFSLKFYKNLS